MSRSSIGAALKAARGKAGYSQGAVADHIGVSRQAVSQWDAGETSPSMENLLAVCKFIGADLTSIIEGAPDFSDPGGRTPHSAETILAVAVSQWQSIPSPQQIITALAAGGFKVVPVAEESGDLADKLRALRDGKSTGEVGARIALARKEKGMTQADLAEAVGCHMVTVAKLETNVMDVTVEWLLRIADAIGVGAAVLLSDDLGALDVKAARERLGWSQQWLADVAGTTQQTVDRIERGLVEHSRATPAIVRALRGGSVRDAADDPLAFVQDVMNRHGLTSTTLAKKAGLAASTLNKALRNPNNGSLLHTRTLQKIKEWDRAQRDYAGGDA